MIGSKKMLHRAMTFQGKNKLTSNHSYVGQLHLPYEKSTTQDFLVEILRGQKKVLHEWKVKPIIIPMNAWTTKEKLAEMIKENATLLAYFPDDPLTQCDRQFMIDVINTMDPNYFP